MSDFNFDQAAQALFSTPTTQPTQRTTQQPVNDEQAMAEKLFGAPPAPQHPAARRAHDTRPVEALTEAELAERMFGNAEPALNHSDGMRAIEQAAMQEFLASPEEASQAAEHWGSVFQAVGLNASESARIADIGIATFTSPATPEVRTSWVEQAQQALVQDFGPQCARAALDDARRFVAIHAGPDLREVLEATGLGDHPHIVRLIAAKARAARLSGNLK